MDLDGAQRRWLREHTLEELQSQFKRDSLKEVGKAGCTSHYRGVSAARAKWRAQFNKKIGGTSKIVFRKEFESERDAATAYDHIAIQWNGR